MANPYAELRANRFTRKWGTESGSAVDPYITGYFHTKWSGFPSMTTQGGLETTEIPVVLSASCVGVTVPGGTVNKVEIQGMGGIRWGAIGNSTYDNTISMRFIEFSKTPILDIFHQWFRKMREYKTGVSLAMSGSNEEYTKSNYSANLYYWTTKPNGIEVELAICAAGMYPMRDPQDLYQSSVETNDRVEVDMDFHSDYIWRDNWVYDNVAGYMGDITSERDAASVDYDVAT